MAGCSNISRPAPDLTVPEPSDSLDKDLAPMADSGDFTPAEVVDLLTSHTVAAQDHADPASLVTQATPFGSTSSTFDAQLLFC
ncbi:hypothetical protein BC835DRAFT_1444196 [Cytidiella melzeri]|nr:hypothetical protein BC835DRAFT_1444196 [Cytidiella melzeri]